MMYGFASERAVTMSPSRLYYILSTFHVLSNHNSLVAVGAFEMPRSSFVGCTSTYLSNVHLNMHRELFKIRLCIFAFFCCQLINQVAAFGSVFPRHVKATASGRHSITSHELVPHRLSGLQHAFNSIGSEKCSARLCLSMSAR